MKILYITITDKKQQGDYLEVMALRSLRSALGDNCIDYPKKKIVYGDWSEIDKESLHGKGFTIYTPPLKEIKSRDYEDVDAIVYGFVNKPHYVNDVYPEIEKLDKPRIYIDGHDDAEVVKVPSIKHELRTPQPRVYPMNLAIPSSKIRKIDFSRKNQVFQKTAPPWARFKPMIMGEQGRKLYIFDDEEKYYDDMAQSWFGLSCRKGSWDALRNYEIIAAGAVLLFRDYIHKPKYASPVGVPAISYSTPDDLAAIIERLLPLRDGVWDGRPSQEYFNILNAQRRWLINMGTEEKLGEYLVSVIKQEIETQTRGQKS